MFLKQRQQLSVADAVLGNRTGLWYASCLLDLAQHPIAIDAVAVLCVVLSHILSLILSRVRHHLLIPKKLFASPERTTQEGTQGSPLCALLNGIFTDFGIHAVSTGYRLSW